MKAKTITLFIILSVCHFLNRETALKAQACRDTLSVMIIGDVMMHQAQLEKDYTQFLKHISKDLRSADIAVANMEFSLGGEPYTGYPRFSAPDSYAEYVAAECGVDVFLTANNHILDRGQKGLKRTLSVYEGMKEKVLFTGSAGSKEELEQNYPVIIDRKGIKLAIINFTYGTNGIHAEGWPNTNYMVKESIDSAFIRAAKQNADFIAVLPHWGTEYELHHNSTQEIWAGYLVGRGADVIVGGHPHVVQDSTHINGVPVFYSIGNAVSNMSAENTRLELAVTLRFVNDHITGIRTMLEPEIRYMWCCLPGRLNDNFSTIFVKEWLGHRSEWINPSDYDNMVNTYQRVRQETGVSD